MKTIGYLIFAWVYNICSIFCEPDPHRIILWNGHNHGINGNLKEIQNAYSGKAGDVCEAFAKRDLFRNPDSGMRKSLWGCIHDAFLFFVVYPCHMARAGKVFLNDNFLPLCYMRTTKRDTQFVQLWHGAGAFKRFGLSTETDPKVAEVVRSANRKITHLFHRL